MPPPTRRKEPQDLDLEWVARELVPFLEWAFGEKYGRPQRTKAYWVEKVLYARSRIDNVVSILTWFYGPERLASCHPCTNTYIAAILHRLPLHNRHPSPLPRQQGPSYTKGAARIFERRRPGRNAVRSHVCPPCYQSLDVRSVLAGHTPESVFSTSDNGANA